MRSIPIITLISLMWCSTATAQRNTQKLHDTIQSGDIAQIREDVTQDNINWIDGRGFAPMHYAVHAPNCVHILNAFKELGADINQAQTGDPSIMHVRINDKRISMSDGLTPLHIAALNSQTKAVKWLLKEGADRQAKDGLSQTPLDLATNSEIKKLLKDNTVISTTTLDIVS